MRILVLCLILVKEMDTGLTNFKEVTLFAEYKQTMGYLNMHLFSRRFSDKLSCENSIQVEGNRISIEDVVSSVTFKFEDLKFDPSTCRTLQYNGQGSVTFTLQVEKPPSEILSVTQRNNDQQQQFVKEIKANQNRCYCKFCGQKILKDTCHFLRVLPLPSENWSEFSDMWFCHNHSHTSNEESHVTDQKPTELRPKLKDCFVAESYFTILLEQIKEESVMVLQDNCIRCRRCRNLLGEVHPEKNGVSKGGKVIKVLRSSVHFITEDNSPVTSEETVLDRGGEAEDMFARLLMEHSKMYTSFKLYLTTSTEGKQFDCLIWIIDPKLWIFKGSAESGCENLTSIHVIKVLFRALLQSEEKHKEEEEERNSWKKDNSVHIISLPYSSCLTLLKILIDNSKCLPSKCRKHDKFYVGYLKYLPKRT